ncbi:hypothetical protein RchiOBHm_Chr2g0157651 [Rosa chinensis]|uniref:Uncharacterized protein n=1 Tax=Rosa chinensis TaxID=74649 RepID=A0A2P6S1S9_ROSCH|nr:hypothetical protein RchiOBHm_Chr2g0157651 [Rosa chinensis]
MIRRSTSAGFWMCLAVIVIMCAVWVKEVEGYSDLSPCGLSTKGGVNDPTCFWGKGGRKIVKKLEVSSAGRNKVEPHEPEAN